MNVEHLPVFTFKFLIKLRKKSQKVQEHFKNFAAKAARLFNPTKATGVNLSPLPAFSKVYFLESG